MLEEELLTSKGKHIYMKFTNTCNSKLYLRHIKYTEVRTISDELLQVSTDGKKYKIIHNR